MSNSPDQVIDLTDSFCLADHGAMANVIIELDDSLNESGMSSRMPVRYENHANQVPNILVDDNVAPLPVHRKKPKAKKKTQLQPESENRQKQTRERSPLRDHIDDCPICLEKLGRNPLVSTKCGHVFCDHCLVEALRLEKKCPTCRRPMRGKNAFHPLFFGRR